MNPTKSCLVCWSVTLICRQADWAYLKEVRLKALQLYVNGMNLRRIARHLGLHHRTVSLWVQAQADKLPDPPVSNEDKEA
jgi:transposase-like protein